MKQDSGPLQLERLSSAEAPELSRALDVMKQKLPDPSQLASLAAQLSAQGLPLTGNASLPRGLRAARSLRKYWLLGGAALMGVAAVGLLIGREEVPRQRSALATNTPATTADGARLASGAARVIAPTPPPKRATPSSAGLAESPPTLDSASHAKSPSELGSARADSNTGEPLLPVAPSPIANSTSPVSKSIPGGARAVHSLAKPSLSSSVSSAANPVGRPTELVLLRDARLALPTSAALALELTEQHRSLYPRGLMAQERELIAISALARLGRRAAVLARAAQFSRDFPGSPYRKQITELAQ